MKNIFHTEQGSAYVLKCITDNQQNLNVGAIGVILNVEINRDPSGIAGRLNFNTAKRIIPIMAGTKFVRTNGLSPVVEVDIYTPYYRGIRGTAPQVQIFDQQRSQVKLWPYVSRDFLTDDNFYGFTCRYNQTVFNDSDFVDPTGGLLLQFSNNQALALAGQPSNGAVIIGGTYAVSTNFLYYELQ